LNTWQPILGSLKAWLSQVPGHLADVPTAVLLVALLAPVVLAAISRRMASFLGTCLLIALAVTLVTEPAGDATIAVAAYIGSILLALSGVAARRKESVLRAKLANVRAEMNLMAEAESRRFLVQLKTQDAGRNGSGPISSAKG
jgi:hypothetical protein